MLENKHILFGAVCSLLSGSLLLVGWTLNIGRDSIPGASMVLAGYVLAVFAFVAIYSVQHQRLTVLGMLGFFMVISACAIFTPWVFMDVARLSGVAQLDWREVQETGHTHTIGVFGGAGFVFGFFLVGFDTIRAKILNKWPAIILIVAGIMPLLYTWIPIGKLLPRIAGLALIGFGINLLFLARQQN